MGKFGDGEGGGHVSMLKVLKVLCKVICFMAGEAFAGLCTPFQPGGCPPPPTPSLYHSFRRNYTQTEGRGGGGKAPNCKKLQVSVTWWQYTKQVNKTGQKFKHFKGGERKGEGGPHLWDRALSPRTSWALSGGRF